MRVGDRWSLGTLIDYVVAIALTFAVARMACVGSSACCRGFWFAIVRGRGPGAHSQLLPWRSG
jgi:hypothetical protein